MTDADKKKIFGDMLGLANRNKEEDKKALKVDRKETKKMNKV